VQSFRLFVAAYEERSFTLAAAREHATQSGVSQHIRNLEQRHGVQLFRREKGRVQPTPAADVFYAHCLAALRTTDGALAALKPFAEGLTGEAAIGVMPTVSAGALAPALVSFRARHPNARVHVVEAYSGALTGMVAADELDFAVVPAMPAPPGLRIRPFFRTAETLVSRRGAGGTAPAIARLSDLDRLRLVLPEAGNIRTDSIRTFLAAHSVEIAEFIELNSMMATLDLIAQSEWNAILPALMMASHSHHPDLLVRPLEPVLPLELVVVEPARRAPSAVAAAFQDILCDACAALVAHSDRIG
jgi:LysR family transcriptional regulator, nitrogen assimilation regulatory protein